MIECCWLVTLEEPSQKNPDAEAQEGSSRKATDDCLSTLSKSKDSFELCQEVSVGPVDSEWSSCDDSDKPDYDRDKGRDPAQCEENRGDARKRQHLKNKRQPEKSNDQQECGYHQP